MRPVMRWASVGELAAAHGPDVERLVQATRALVRRLVPHAREQLRPGWGLIGYAAPRYFAFIAPGRGLVKLGFEWGVRLEDPAGLLTGTGRQVRHVEVATTRVLRARALHRLVIDAAALALDSRARRPRG
jgi:hypothetical protein